jgi:Xaa-Pro aminopeptidase
MRLQLTVLAPSLIAVLSTCTSMQAQSSEASPKLGPASAAMADPIASIERPGDGKPVCGLGRSFHAGRRKALREALGKGVVVVRGLPDVRDYMQFRQDKVFWYLTGVESPNAALVMDCASGREVLLLPAADQRRESWDGELWDAGDAWVRELTGIGDVRSSAKLDEVLRDFIQDGTKIWVSMHPHVALAGCCDRAVVTDKAIRGDPFDGRTSRERALATALENMFHIKPTDCSEQIAELRRVKQPEEIAAMRRAARAGALAMAEAIRSTSAGLGEWELDGLMSWFHVRNGAAGPAYHPIIGSGANSLVLHYEASNRRMQDGEVLLIDYAPEVDHYTSDITRTWPVNGRFSARQAELYDAVLEAQAAGIAAVKPGATIDEISQACDTVFERKGLGNLTRHGPCHYIGLEVHDEANYGAPFVQFGLGLQSPLQFAAGCQAVEP